MDEEVNFGEKDARVKYARLISLLIAVFAAAVCAAGCHKTATDADGIRAAVTQHLLELKTLNLQAMNMDITNTSIQGNQAKAFVTFRPKTGAPAGAGMQIAYLLEKRDGNWSVLRTDGMGGAIDHPSPGANPHATPGQNGVLANIPDIRELMPPANNGANGSLPPGHPPVKVPPQPPK